MVFEPSELIILVILLIILLKLLIFRFFDRFIKDPCQLHVYKHRSTMVLIVSLVTLFVALFIVTEDRSQIFKYLSITSAGLAIALHDTISNFSGWLFIIYKKPFAIGDRIAVGNGVGDVINLSILYTTILEVGNNRISAEQSTGRLIHIPNALVLRNEIINYNQGFNFIWHEVELTVTYESDWQKAKQTILEVVTSIAGHYPEQAKQEFKKAERMFELKHGKLTPIVYTHIVDYGIGLTMRFIVNPRQVRTTESRILETILLRFCSDPSINFAYPTTRFYTSPESTHEKNTLAN